MMLKGIASWPLHIWRHVVWLKIIFRRLSAHCTESDTRGPGWFTHYWTSEHSHDLGVVFVGGYGYG